MDLNKKSENEILDHQSVIDVSDDNPLTNTYIKEFNIGKVIYVSFLFFLMFTIFNGFQNIITLLYIQLGYASLGPFTMLVMFGVRAISNLFGPALADKYAYNQTFFFASSSILLFLLISKAATYCGTIEAKASIGCNNIIMYITHFFGATIFGFFGSIIWATQSSYINECASNRNKGKLFGIFWSFMACSQIAGNGLTTIILKTEEATGLFNIYIVIALVVIVLFMFVRDPDPIQEDTSASADIMEPKFEINSIINIEDFPEIKEDPSLDTIQTLENLLPNNEQLNNEISSSENDSTFLRFLAFFKHKKIRPCLPLFLMQGYSFTIFITTMSVLVYHSLDEGSQGDKNQKVGLVFLVFGIVEVIAGQVFGWLFDKVRSYSITCYCLVNVACIITMYSAYLTNSYLMFLLAASSYAFADVGGETVIGGLLSLRFKEKIEPFVVFRCISTCGAAFIMGVYMFFPTLNPLFMVVGVFSVIICATWYFRHDLQSQYRVK